VFAVFCRSASTFAPDDHVLLGSGGSSLLLLCFRLARLGLVWLLLLGWAPVESGPGRQPQRGLLDLGLVDLPTRQSQALVLLLEGAAGLVGRRLVVLHGRRVGRRRLRSRPHPVPLVVIRNIPRNLLRRLLIGPCQLVMSLSHLLNPILLWQLAHLPRVVTGYLLPKGVLVLDRVLLAPNFEPSCQGFSGTRRYFAGVYEVIRCQGFDCLLLHFCFMILNLRSIFRNSDFTLLYSFPKLRSGLCNSGPCNLESLLCFLMLFEYFHH